MNSIQKVVVFSRFLLAMQLLLLALTFSYLQLETDRLNLWVSLIVSLSLLLLFRNPYRSVGVIPYTLLVLMVGYALGGFGLLTFSGFEGLLLGLQFLNLLVLIRASLYYAGSSKPRPAGGAGASLLLLALAIPGSLLILLIEPLSRTSASLIILIGLLVQFVLFVIGLKRAWAEFTASWFIHLMYRIKIKQQGTIPRHEPVIIIANHASWMDPLLLAKVIPRPFIPMMTARFFDLWFLKPLLTHVFEVIRVEERALRREAPEIGRALQALDRGETVLIFPEGYLQRKDEPVLRRFGQGIWRILAAKPKTPVIACWIEGVWGSFFSYRFGPPTKNKKLDRFRKVQIAVSEPHIIPEEILQHHMTTRIHLMKKVLEVRELLALAPITTPPVLDEAEATSEEEA